MFSRSKEVSRLVGRSYLRRNFCTVDNTVVPPQISPWKTFFAGCNRHKFKLFVLFSGIGGTVFRKEIAGLWQDKKLQASKDTQKLLAKDQELSKIVEAFLIRTIIDVLASPEVLNNSIDFTTVLINNPALQQELLKFLLAGLQHPQFLEEVKKLSINLVVDVLKDKQIQTDLLQLLAVNFTLKPESVQRSTITIRGRRNGKIYHDST